MLYQVCVLFDNLPLCMQYNTSDTTLGKTSVVCAVCIGPTSRLRRHPFSTQSKAAVIAWVESEGVVWRMYVRHSKPARLALGSASLHRAGRHGSHWQVCSEHRLHVSGGQILRRDYTTGNTQAVKLSAAPPFFSQRAAPPALHLSSPPAWLLHHMSLHRLLVIPLCYSIFTAFTMPTLWKGKKMKWLIYTFQDNNYRSMLLLNSDRDKKSRLDRVGCHNIKGVHIAADRWVLALRRSEDEPPSASSIAYISIFMSSWLREAGGIYGTLSWAVKWAPLHAQLCECITFITFTSPHTCHPSIPITYSMNVGLTTILTRTKHKLEQDNTIASKYWAWQT